MEHLGVKINWIIYSNRKKNLPVGEVVDYLIECIEKRGWYCGGGAEPVDLGGDRKSKKKVVK